MEEPEILQPTNTAGHLIVRRPRTLAGLLLALLAATVVLGLADPAYAHATFEEQLEELAASTQQDVTLHVPIEPFEFTNDPDPPDPSNFFNVRIETQIPAGWTVISCAQAGGWDCSFSATQITWNNKSGSIENDKREEFVFTLKTPATSGTYFFPTVQTYNSGCGGGCKPDWKPGLTVAAAATTTTAAGATTTTTAAGATTTTTSRSGGQSIKVVVQDKAKGTTTTAPATTTTPAPGVTTTTAGSGTGAGGGSRSDGDGLGRTGISLATLIKLVAGVLLVGLGGLVRKARRRD